MSEVQEESIFADGSVAQRYAAGGNIE